MSKVIITNVDGSSASATILPIDRVMFERQFGRGVGAIAKEEREEFLLWVSWHALKRQGFTAADFDGWLATVADYDSEADDLPPSDPAASPTP
jgi:hypothetical protein